MFEYQFTYLLLTIQGLCITSNFSILFPIEISFHLTNDGAIILNILDVDHPASKVRHVKLYNLLYFQLLYSYLLLLFN